MKLYASFQNYQMMTKNYKKKEISPKCSHIAANNHTNLWNAPLQCCHFSLNNIRKWHAVFEILSPLQQYIEPNKDLVTTVKET